MHSTSILSSSFLLFILLTSCKNNSTVNRNSIRSENKKESINQPLQNTESIADDAKNEIMTSSGYIWEVIDNEAELYTTLAFYPDGSFNTTVYQMTGASNHLKPIGTLNGSWKITEDGKSAIGRYDIINDTSINWQFNTDYSSLTNDKGAVFNRIKLK